MLNRGFGTSVAPAGAHRLPRDRPLEARPESCLLHRGKSRRQSSELLSRPDAREARLRTLCSRPARPAPAPKRCLCKLVDGQEFESYNAASPLSRGRPLPPFRAPRRRMGPPIVGLLYLVSLSCEDLAHSLRLLGVSSLCRGASVCVLTVLRTTAVCLTWGVACIPVTFLRVRCPLRSSGVLVLQFMLSCSAVTLGMPLYLVILLRLAFYSSPCVGGIAITITSSAGQHYNPPYPPRRSPIGKVVLWAPSCYFFSPNVPPSALLCSWCLCEV